MRMFLAALCLWMMVAPSSAAEQATKVDLLLVLAADVSESINESKFAMQRNAYADAIEDPDVVRAATSGEHRRIGVIFLEWSDANRQRVVVDWRVIDGTLSAQAFAELLRSAPRSFSGFTAIGSALQRAKSLLEVAPYISARRIIDLSGDGTSNRGVDVLSARDMVVAAGITINALVILTPEGSPWPEHVNPPGGLEKYFVDNVIGGPGSFTIVAGGFPDFARAIRRKLLTEIASR